MDGSGGNKVSEAMSNFTVTVIKYLMKKLIKYKLNKKMLKIKDPVWIAVDGSLKLCFGGHQEGICLGLMFGFIAGSPYCCTAQDS